MRRLQGVLYTTLFVTLPTFWACPGLARPQTLVIAEDVDIAGFDPALNESPWAFRPLVYNGLVELDLDFRVSPALAERWETSPDGLAWTFFLREGATFHDGTPLTSEIVKKHFDRLREGSQKSWLSAIGNISTPDPWTPNATGTLERDGTSLTLSLTVVANNSENMLPAAAIQHAPGRASSAASPSDSRLPIQELSVLADASTRRVET